jgi:hypothetical protein
LIVEGAPDWVELAELALKSYGETAPDTLRRGRPGKR